MTTAAHNTVQQGEALRQLGARSFVLLHAAKRLPVSDSAIRNTRSISRLKNSIDHSIRLLDQLRDREPRAIVLSDFTIRAVLPWVRLYLQLCMTADGPDACGTAAVELNLRSCWLIEADLIAQMYRVASIMKQQRTSQSERSLSDGWEGAACRAPQDPSTRALAC